MIPIQGKNVLCPQCNTAMVWNNECSWYDCPHPHCGAAWTRVQPGKYS